MKNGFMLYPTPQVGMRPDDEEIQMSLQDMELRLFGISRINNIQQTLTDQDFIPIKT